MEERVPPTHEANQMPTQHIPSNEHGQSLSSFNDDDNNNPRPLIILAQPPGERNTLVIQIPKDQIYRVPPPENAKIVESYRNPVNKGNKTRCTCCFWAFLALVLVGLFTGITILVIKNVYEPEATTFSIVDVHVTNKTEIGYEFMLKSKNPSENLGITITRGGVTSLNFKSQKLSTGKFPELSLKGQGSKNVHITLNGSKSGLPKEIDEIMKDKKLSDHPVSLELTMDFSAKFNMGILNFWGEKEMMVDCNFKVNSLKKSGNKILSQKCGSKIKK